MQSFMIHAGGSEVGIDEVRRVQMPEATDSYQPIAHERMIELVTGAMADMGLVIAQQQYALAKDGQRFFGLFDLRGDQPDYNLVFGLRNSHDKTFPAAISLGSRVFVCDNLAFSGEIQISRRHTRHIERDLPALVAKATAALVESRQVQHKRIEAYKGFEIDDRSAHDLIVNGARNGLFPASDIINVAKEWHEPTYEDFRPRTGWSLFNAFTEVAKRWGNALPMRTAKLHGVFDSACGVVSRLESLRSEATEDIQVAISN